MNTCFWEDYSIVSLAQDLTHHTKRLRSRKKIKTKPQKRRSLAIKYSNIQRESSFTDPNGQYKNSISVGRFLRNGASFLTWLSASLQGREALLFVTEISLRQNKDYTLLFKNKTPKLKGELSFLVGSLAFDLLQHQLLLYTTRIKYSVSFCLTLSVFEPLGMKCPPFTTTILLFLVS